MHWPSVSLIVLNYNSLQHLDANLTSLTELDYPAEQLEILLVDNDSSDGSVAWVREHFPQVRIVENGDNLGFAGGNNAGVEAARHEWVAILNPDTRVPPNWLQELVRPLFSRAHLVCIASKMLAWDGKTIDFGDAALNFMGWGCQPGFGSTQLNGFDQEKQLLFACGGAMLIRRDVFLEMGGFDPDYFAYFEDVDLGLRLWLNGHSVWFAPRAIVYHRHHGSWGDVASARTWLLAERNTLFTMIKNYDYDSLARMLPAALLLTLQRAYLDANLDPAAFGTPAAPSQSVYGAQYYLGQVGQLLRRGEVRDFVKRTADELERRWQKRGERQAVKAARPYSQPVHDHYRVPAVVLSRLLAGKELLASLPTLLEKRAEVQRGRALSDHALFPLFQWTLRSNFGDERFIQAMNHVVDRFQLKQYVNGETTPLPAAVHELSWSVSRHLMQKMAGIFNASHASRSAFQMDGTIQPDPAYQLSVADITELVEMNSCLWQLPELPFPELLVWLRERV